MRKEYQSVELKITIFNSGVRTDVIGASGWQEKGTNGILDTGIDYEWNTVGE